MAHLITRKRQEIFYFYRGTGRSSFRNKAVVFPELAYFYNNWTFSSAFHNAHKYFIIQTVNACDAPQQILKHLHKRIRGLKRVYNVEECDVILDFCPIVSRAGTDMEAALIGLNSRSASKPAVFMVLHHTFEREKIVPDSSRFVNRENTLTVNFLFNEDVGLLKCAINDDALTTVIEHVKAQFFPQNQFHYKVLLKKCFWTVLGIAVVYGIKCYLYSTRIGHRDYHRLP